MTKSKERLDAFYVCVPHLKMFRHPSVRFTLQKYNFFLNNANICCIFCKKNIFIGVFATPYYFVNSLFCLLLKSKHMILISPLAYVHNKMVCLIDDFISRTRYLKSLNYTNILSNNCFKTQV